MIADNGEGILIDWDLCSVFPQWRPSQTEGLQELTVARRLERKVSLDHFFLPKYLSLHLENLAVHVQPATSKSK